MITGFKAGLMPEPALTVSEWADLKRILSTKSSAMPGNYRTSLTPYLKEIMDNLSEYSPYEKIVLMKAAQIGATEAAINFLGYTIDISPCPVLYVLPTLDTCELTSKNRIQPMIDDSPTLLEKVGKPRSRDSGNTILKKEFPGGIIRIVGANSAAGLRSMPVKRLILDEVDAYDLDLEGEGDPIELAIKRTATYANRTIFILSTPTIKGLSTVEKHFEGTDKRYYNVPCTECGTLQDLVFDQLRYTFDRVSNVAVDVYYECKYCQGRIDEMYKPKILADGKWVPTVTDYRNEKTIGYHINSLYSPLGWYSWANAATDYEKAQGDLSKLKTFTNTVLGLTYEEKGEKPDWTYLYNRREDYMINRIPSDDVVFLTAGVDVQKDRIELEIVGWCEGKISYSIDYRVLRGYVAGDGYGEVWSKLADVLEETWSHPSGGSLQIKMMCIDSGYSTSEVYAFCKRYPPSRVVPIKGYESLITMTASPRPVNVTRKNKSVDGLKVWRVGVNVIKEELYGWLKLEDVGPGYCHFPKYDEVYFQGLVSEEKIVRSNKRNQNVYEWVKKYSRNEPLDCRVYARAAANMVGMDSFTGNHWDTLKKQRNPKKIIKVRKSNFL